MSMTGPDPSQPTKVGVPIGDLLAGMYEAFGVLAALNERHRTGRGRLVRASLLAALVGVHAFQGTRYTVAGEVARGTGNHHSSIAPYGLFRTADVPVQVAVGSEALWRAFAPLVGLDVHDERFTSNERRVAHRAELIDVEHPTAGPIRLPGPPLRFDDNSYAGDREAHLPPPLLGEYDRGVREWLDELDAGERA